MIQYNINDILKSFFFMFFVENSPLISDNPLDVTPQLNCHKSLNSPWSGWYIIFEKRFVSITLFL